MSNSNRTTRLNSKSSQHSEQKITPNDSTPGSSQQEETSKTLSGIIRDVQESLKAEMISMKTIIDDRFRDLEERINAKLMEIAGKYESRIENLEKTVEKLSNRHEELEARYRSTDVAINGIPVSPNENVHEIFNKIATKIGHQTNTFHDIFRIKSFGNKNAVRMAPPIIIKFSSSVKKMHFLRAHKHNSVTLRDIGFVTDSSVYVSDSLSSKQRHIHYIARKLKKEGRLAKVMVKNGMVHVIFCSGGRPTIIYNKEDLTAGAGADQATV